MSVNTGLNNRFLNQPVTYITTNYTALSTDVIIEVTNISSALTITLPGPQVTGNVGKAFVVKDSSGGATLKNIFIVPASGLIDGARSITITSNYGSAQIFCDGSNYYSCGSNTSGSFIINKQVFTVNGTYTPSNGMSYCEIEAVGGGGAGGGGAATGGLSYSGGAGGGGGEYAFGVFSAAQIGNSQSITIGSPGSASSGAAGGNGGVTSVGSLISANGGSGGTTTSAAYFNISGPTGGSGGTGGSYRFPGDVGGNSSGSVTSFTLFGGIGGSSVKGAGGRGGLTSSGSGGLGYGAGGGGGSQTTSGSAVSGGAGTAGAVFIKEYISVITATQPLIQLACASWSRQSSSSFTPGATVIQTSFASDPGTTPSNTASRLDLSSLTENIGNGMTISQFQVTITQAGAYQIVVDNASVWVSSLSNTITQLVKNGTTVLAMGSAQIQTGAPLESSGINYTGSFNVGDTIDVRYNTASAASWQFWNISVSIAQIPSTTMIPGANWNPILGTTQAMLQNNNYYTQNSSLTNLTLPSNCIAGTVMSVAGSGTGGWIIAQNAGQSIFFENQQTSTGTGGSLASTLQYDAISLLCLTSNTQFVVISGVGNFLLT